MSYVYRYIDMRQKEVVYVGKVKGFKDTYCDPLSKRHEQHKRDSWYREHKGDSNLMMQYIELDNHADADALETLFISMYDGTEQLANKMKTNWGKTSLDLSGFEEQWNWYDPPSDKSKCDCFDRFMALIEADQNSELCSKLVDLIKTEPFEAKNQDMDAMLDDTVTAIELKGLLTSAKRVWRFSELQKYGRPPYKRET